jgi:GWxTD domain-containing protein
MMPRSLSSGVLAVAVLLAGCGSWGRPGVRPSPRQGETLTEILDLNSVYRRLGRLTAGDPLPFIADVGFFGAPGDSTIMVVGLSLENRNFAFQREADVFVARYRVEVSVQPVSGGKVVQATKDQVVRVGSFAETQRSDESILYQDGLTLAPGNWHLTLQVTDRTGLKTGKAEGTYVVPSYGPGSFTAPQLVYQAKARAARSAPVAVILNPRGTLAYGGDTAIAFVEAYALPGPTVIPVTLTDARDSLILRDSLRFAGGKEIESSVLRFSPDSAPLGELHIVVGSGARIDSTMAIISFSPDWVVTNFEDMLSLLRYFPPSEQLDSLRKAPPAERGRLWKVFWRATDPNSATPNHEDLDIYFARIALANARFREEGMPGWRTDRGETLVRLGEPDEVFDASPASEGRLIRWGYTQYQLALYFVDESGFGRFRLTPASRAELERIVARLSRRDG